MTAQPLFFCPDGKVACTNLFELMRCRYEGSPYCPEEGGSKNVRTIGVTRQGTCHLISLDSRLPDAYAGTIWVTLANAEHSVFLPVNASVTRLDPAYAADQFKPFRYDAALASCHFRCLCALAEKDRQLIGDGVRSYWRKREAELTTEYGSVLAAAAKSATDDAKSLTDYCCRQQKCALEDAKRILDDVLWYLTSCNGTPGDGANSRPRPYAVGIRMNDSQ